jgi:thioesterase domain-containing protein
MVALFASPTLEALARHLEEGESGTWSPLVPLQVSGAKLPFFCVHPLGGGVQAYLPLARHLEPDQPLYGLQAPGLAEGGGETGATTVEEMASRYLDALRTVQPQGPYRLGGWSLGGLIAFEMARQLERAGEEVESLVLIDPSPPGGVPEGMPATSSLEMHVALAANLAFERGLAWTLAPEELRDLTPAERFGHIAAEMSRLGIAGEEIDGALLARYLEACEARIEAGTSYRPEPCSSPVLLLLAGQRPVARPEESWRQLAPGGLHVREVSGNHGTMFQEPHVRELAERLLEHLDSAPIAGSLPGSDPMG